MNIPDAATLIKDSIKKLGLNLSGIKVLTELGTNAFMLTPLIAMMAGADRVFAWTKDSDYGRGDKTVDRFRELLVELDQDPDRFEFAVNERPQIHVRTANIITNSGFVRPLDKKLLIDARPGTAIPLMFEAWELRPGDIDLDFCKQAGLRVGGTWENHPDLRIFDLCGTLAVNMIYDAGHRIKERSAIIFSGDQFGSTVDHALKREGVGKVIVTTDPAEFIQHAGAADFAFFCDYKNESEILGETGLLDLKQILKENPEIGLVHLCGNIDSNYVISRGGKIFPRQDGKAYRMTMTLAHLGLEPVILLNCAGFRVGEILYRKKQDKLCQTII